MNSNHDEPSMLDGMLDEWLAGRSPRRFSVEDLKKASYSPERLAELDDALNAASSDARTVRLAGKSANSYRRPKRSASWIVVWASLAASLLLGAGLWFKLAGQGEWLQSSASQIAVIDGVPASDPTLPPKAGTPDSELNANTGIAAASPPSAGSVPENQSKTSSRPESLAIDSVPSGKSNDSSSDALAATPSSDVAPMAENLIIATINDNLRRTWSKQNISVANSLSSAEWVDRATQKLVGRAATAEEKDRFTKKDTTKARSEFLHQLVDTQDFAKFWGKRLSAYYVGEPIASSSIIPEERLAFVRWMQSTLGKTHRVDRVAESLLVLDDANKSKENAFSPSQFWWSEVGKRGNHVVADLVHTRLLGRQSACERCHNDATIPGADPNRYWSLAAITSGVRVERDAGTRTATARYQWEGTPLFFERNDSTMVAVTPQLPNGQTLDVLSGDAQQVEQAAKRNVQRFAQWMVKSDEFADGQTDFVWNAIFGRSLDAFLSETSNAKEGRELARLLRQQLKANNFDLRQIAVWLASSEAFSRKSATLDGAAVAVASDKDLRELAKRQATLAVFPTASDPTLRSMNRLVAWTERNIPPATNSGEVLAQPVPTPLSTKNGKSIVGPSKNSPRNIARDRVAKLPPEQVQYLASVYTLPEAMEIEIDRLLTTKLSWDQLVEHAFLMTGNSAPTLSELEASKNLLDLVRDRRQALRRIIAARI